MPKPIMGNLIRIDDETLVAWVGGKPLVGWKGLDPSIKTHPTPNMYRNIPTKDAKSYSYRIKGEETKFGVKGDLRAFSRKVFTHLKRYGMDTISYVPDPVNPNVMESIVEKPNLFTKNYVLTQYNSYEQFYDDYDLINAAAAKDYLMSLWTQSWNAR
jgi:hypothetical protein